MGSSATSFFRSPNPRTNASYKGGITFKNDICTSEDLNNRDNNSIVDEEEFKVEKAFDAKTFIENYTITYQRKKDDEVQALLNEFKNMRKLENDKPEHAEKWMQRGESPTKRLICKVLILICYYRNEKSSSYSSTINERDQKKFSSSIHYKVCCITQEKLLGQS